MSEIFIEDKFDPETIAMMQALYSRSSKSVKVHSEKVKKCGSSSFMETFYIGYGHPSIGDCGNTTLFIENVSFLAAKSIQDNPLYSGQETSTRYIDFTYQGHVDPIDSVESQDIFATWMRFYIEASEPLIQHLKERYPRQDQEDEPVWEKAIKARSFDILRSFLPAGMKTQLSWATNLRQAHDQLLFLKYHPLDEIKELSKAIRVELKAKYPSSFSHKEYTTQENYLQKHAMKMHYLDSTADYSHYDDDFQFKYSSTIDNVELEEECLELIAERPEKTPLPKFIAGYGQFKLSFLLDFGSFRDVQRHRNGVCQMPLLTAKMGFNAWYLNQLPDDLRNKAILLIDSQLAKITALQKSTDASDATMQYFLPLGMNVACKLSYSLPQMVYVTELRSGVTVHPTLRKIAHQMHVVLKKEHPHLNLFSDLSLNDWDVRRGLQDIVEKQSSEAS